MKITAVRTFLLDRLLLVRVETDAGLHGIGEATWFGRELTVRTAIDELGRYFVDQDPRRIEHHWQSRHRHVFWRNSAAMTAALGAVEVALWDILGKSLGAPIWQLLGGATRDRIRVYAGLGDVTDETAVPKVRAAVERGFTAVKVYPFDAVKAVDSFGPVQRAVRRVAAIREAAGWDVDICIDCHGRLSPTMAVIAEEELRPLRPLFLEEPVLPDAIASIEKVARHAKVPLATGERLPTKWRLREVIERELISVVQPGLFQGGGILEGRKVAAMAEAHYLAVAPHNPFGPVNTMACLHLDAGLPNFLIQEVSGAVRPEWYRALFTGLPVIRDGYAELPAGPGLGIDFDPGAVEAAAAAHPFVPYDQRIRLHEDGSIADS